MTRGGRVRLGVLVALAVLVFDQASKFWVLEILRLPERGQVAVMPVLSLTMVWNRGVTFGLLDHAGEATRVVLAVAALGIVALLGLWLWRAQSALVAGAIGAIAGGAVGNVIDRLRFGAVVDFIHAHAWGWSWYVFNLADAAIVCGVATLLLDGVRPRRDGTLALPARGAPGKEAPHAENC